MEFKFCIYFPITISTLLHINFRDKTIQNFPKEKCDKIKSTL